MAFWEVLMKKYTAVKTIMCVAPGRNGRVRIDEFIGSLLGYKGCGLRLVPVVDLLTLKASLAVSGVRVCAIFIMIIIIVL